MFKILFWGGVLYFCWRNYWRYVSGFLSPSELWEYFLFCGIAFLILVIYRKVHKQPLVW